MSQPIIDPNTKAVAFDAVGTVLYPEPSVSAAYASVATRHGSELTEQDIRSRFGPAMAVFDDDSQANDFRTNESQERLLWEQVVTRVLTDVDDVTSCFDELWEWFGRPEAWRVFDDVAETLEALRSRGLSIAIASNFDHRLHAVCEGLPEVATISKRVVSSEVGYRKPSAGYYNRLAEVCGVLPQQVLMVGDTPTNDIEGARAVGMRAVLVDRSRDADLPDRVSSLKQILS